MNIVAAEYAIEDLEKELAEERTKLKDCSVAIDAMSTTITGQGDRLRLVRKSIEEWRGYASRLPCPLGVLAPERDSILALCLELEEVLEGKRK